MGPAKCRTTSPKMIAGYQPTPGFPKKLRCLGVKCTRQFLSPHPGVRFCQRCTHHLNHALGKVCRLEPGDGRVMDFNED